MAGKLVFFNYEFTRSKREPSKSVYGVKIFMGGSGILPLHFLLFFFSQTQSANGATEHGNAGTRE